MKHFMVNLIRHCVSIVHLIMSSSINKLPVFVYNHDNEHFYSPDFYSRQFCFEIVWQKNVVLILLSNHLKCNCWEIKTMYCYNFLLPNQNIYRFQKLHSLSNMSNEIMLSKLCYSSVLHTTVLLNAISNIRIPIPCVYSCDEIFSVFTITLNMSYYSTTNLFYSSN